MKILWTDGSAVPNPGPGGYAVIEEKDGKGFPVVMGREDETTNIRMEGKALIAAIKYAGDEKCRIHTDSEFWINVLDTWGYTWKARGWTKKGGEIKNLDLVKELFELYHENDVELYWTKGHIGTELNEMADNYANRAREGETV